MESRLGPVTLTERVHLLDVLRGMALFGIIASNMRAFNGPIDAYLDSSLMWQELENRIAQAFIDIFISSKFITLFSLLFGIGFAVQMERADACGLTKPTFYLRRLAVLLLLGVAHMYLLWWGDILTAYALMGFLLFLFRRKSQRQLLWWSAGLYCWPYILIAAFLAVSLAGAQVPPAPTATSEELQRVITVYSTGTYGEIFQERLKDSFIASAFLLFFSPHFLGIFVFGMWLWRTGMVRNVAAHIPTLRRCLWWGLFLGLSLNAVSVAIQEIGRPNSVAPLGLFKELLAGLAIPALSLFYACGLALLFQREEWRRRLQPFSAMGRTALTNYLLQTVIATTLFYSHGFGLFGQVGPLAGLGVSILIYAFQVVASVAWMRRFSFGPVEWLWRTLTYGRPPGTSAAGGG
jgi:uncharacterized protein